MKAAVNWKENMTFIGTPASGFSVQMDADVSAGGNGNGVRPMEMIALGLAGCVAMDVISILQKKRQQITGFEVRVDAPRSADHPKVFTSARITFVVTGTNIEEPALLRSIELAATRYCPVQAMLGQVMPMDMHYEIYEDAGDGNRRLAYQGVWQEMPNE